MQIFSRRDDRTATVIVSISGDIDIAALPTLNSAIDRAVSEGTFGVILDLRGVNSIDSTGVALVSGLRERCKRAGSRDALATSNGDVRAHLRDRGVESPIFSDPSAALASFEDAMT